MSLATNDIARHTGGFACPVCGGTDDDARGHGRRCWGFTGDGYTRCTREEHAGLAPFDASSEAWVHRIKGPCKCGQEHGPADPKPRQQGRSEGPGRHIKDYFYGDENGCALFKVSRYATSNGKTFRQFRADGTTAGGQVKWAAGLGDVVPILYRLRDLHAADPAKWVFFCEGEKDADRLASLGLVATCSPMGAEAPGRKRWEAGCYVTDLAGRKVVIVPDNDVPGREFGELVASKVAPVASKVAPVAAEVKVLDLAGNRPDLPERGDVSDWLDMGGTADLLLELAEHLPTWEPSREAAAMTGDGELADVNEAINDPHRLARLYRNQRCQGDDGLRHRYWQGSHSRYFDGRYHTQEEKELRADLSNVIKSEFDRANLEMIGKWRKTGGHKTGEPKPTAIKVSESLKSNVLGAFSGLTLVTAREAKHLPVWLDGEGPWPAGEVLAAPNGLFHLPSLVANREPFRVEPTPRFFSTFCLDYTVKLDAPPPVNWLTFLGAKPIGDHSRVKLQLWPDDPQAIESFQEWMGLQIVPDTSFQKIAGLIGPRRSGKGTIARILKAMVGPENVAGPTLSGLGTNFGLAPLIGRQVAIISDARLSGRTDQAVIVERLLSISGEDTLDIDRKYLPVWTGKLPTRFTFLSNELPRLSDASGALSGRFLIFRFTRSFYGQEDRGLTDLLLSELPGILLWAIEGWRRLHERGHFIQPESGREMIENMEDLASPVGAFVREECEVGPGYEVAVEALFETWGAWCKKQNRDHPGTVQTFGRDLSAALPGIRVTRPRDGDTRIRKYDGITIKSKF